MAKTKLPDQYGLSNNDMLINGMLRGTKLADGRQAFILVGICAEEQWATRLMAESKGKDIRIVVRASFIGRAGSWTCQNDEWRQGIEDLLELGFAPYIENADEG